MRGTRFGSAIQQIGRLFDEGTLTGLADSELLDRFLARGDGVAFRILIERHGPMVLSVCRATLGNGPHVEDAFQATFLVLIRKAPTIRGQGALGAWLHRVAYRVAVASNIAETRRRKREQPISEATEPVAPHSTEAFDDRDRLAALHNEIARLPEKYSRPIILCYLEGKSHAQAAAELACGEATLRRRLSSARNLLRSRLTRRGLAPATAIATLEALANSTSAAVPTIWIEAITKAASALPTGKLVATGAISASAAHLARSVSTSFLIGKLQGLAAVASAVLAFGMIGMHTIPAGFAQTDKGETIQKNAPDPKNVSPPQPQPKADDHPQAYSFSGIVLDPEGKPFAGAKITVEGKAVKETAKSSVRAISGADGRFRFECPASDFVLGVGRRIPLASSAVARAEGFALGAANYRGASESLTLRLALDNVPIRGRIVDPEGKPVPGISVSVRKIRMNESGDLAAWLNWFDSKIARKPTPRRDRASVINQSLEGNQSLLPVTVTDRDGRFQITGIGRERLAELRVEGPTIETALIMVGTRLGSKLVGSINPKDQQKPPSIIYGASLNYTAHPSRPIEGIVRDRETGRPLAGMTVRSEYAVINNNEFISTMTDVKGRYRVTGMRTDRMGSLLAMAPCDRSPDWLGWTINELPDESLPYMRLSKYFREADPTSNEPIRVDFELQRGIWIAGRVLDQSTGQPVPARVSYVAYFENPTLSQVGADAFGHEEYGQDTTADGSFRLAVFPGPGLVGVLARGSNYANGVGIENIPRFANYHAMEPLGYACAPISLSPRIYNTLAEINPKAGDPTIVKDLLLDTGHTLALETVDADGKPLKADACAGLNGTSYWNDRQGSRTNFRVEKLVPGKKQIVTARNITKALIGQIELNGKEERPARLTLVPWGEITGRLVFPEGKPAVEDLDILSQTIAPITPAPWAIRLNKDGRFHIEGLIPGRSYRFAVSERKRKVIHTVFQDLSVKSGEVKDLGDVVMKPTK